MFRKYVQSVCFVLEETNVTMQNAGLANITSENYFFILQILVPQEPQDLAKPKLCHSERMICCSTCRLFHG